jgi:putative transposase
LPCPECRVRFLANHNFGVQRFGHGKPCPYGQFMKYDPTKHHRRSVRFKGFDYAAPFGYYVTICVHEKRCAFGRVVEGAVHHNAYGKMVDEEWKRTGESRGEIALDEYIVMPNHFHAIVIIRGAAPNDPTRNNDATDRRGMACHAQLDDMAHDEGMAHEGMARHAPTFGQPQARALGTIIGAFKGAVKRRINAHRAERGLSPIDVWQRSFHDRIIRDETELNAIRKYIIENPLHWHTDEHHP